MKITTLGIDLAKDVFRVHGCDARGKVMVSKSLTRRQLAEFIAKLPACLVGMEACATAHYWAREMQRFGHQVRLMSPNFVRPYVKNNKNDSRDAEAICEAAFQFAQQSRFDGDPLTFASSVGMVIRSAP